jgi:hypothetical protein
MCLMLLAAIMQGMQYDKHALASIKLFAYVGIQLHDQAATHYHHAGHAVL